MAEKRRFKVPSLDDDGDSTPEQFRPQSLFAVNRPKLKSTTERGESSEKVQISERSSANKSKVADKQPTALKDTSKSQPIISQQTFQKQPIGSQQQIVSKPDNSKATKLTESPNINIEETVTKTLMYKPIQTLQKPASEEVKASVLPANPIKSANNCILVSPRQRGNPILKFIRSVPYEFDEIVADYQMGRTTCALYLSLRYHQLNPDYIHERLKQLGRAYDLRVLLAQVDVKDPSHALKDLAKVAILADCTLVAAFSPEEAGRYLETYKAFEAKPPDLIMEKTEGTYLSRFSDCLTSVKKINKTDAMTLLSTFGTFESLVQSSEEDLSLCPGFGPQKAQRLSHVLREPFLKPTTKRKVTTTEETVTEGGAAASSSVGKDKA